MRKGCELRSNQSSRSYCGERLLDALRKRLVGRDSRLGISDRFEVGLNFEVEREGSIVRGMRGVGFQVETPASGFIGTGALDDRPGLSEFAGEFENAVDLVASRESAAVEEDLASGSHFAAGSEPRRASPPSRSRLARRSIRYLPARTSAAANLVFAEERALCAAGQFACERGLAGSRETGHENNHAAEIVAEAKSGSRLSWRRLPQRPRQ